MGFLLGMYGSDAKSLFHSVRKIRNEFAHELEVAFVSEKVTKLAEPLKFIDRYFYTEPPSSMRERYVFATKFLMGALSQLRSVGKRPKAPLDA